jgi:hypothetical protein
MMINKKIAKYTTRGWHLKIAIREVFWTAQQGCMTRGYQ